MPRWDDAPVQHLIKGCVVLLLVVASTACASNDPEDTPRVAQASPSESASTTPSYPTAEIEVGVGPGALASGFGSIWVADHTGSTVTRIDPATNEAVETIKTAGEPTGIAVGYDSVWTFGAIAQTVNRIDPSSNKVIAKIKLETQGGGIVGGVDLDGSMWFPGEEGNVFRVDPSTDKVIATIRVNEDVCPGNIAGGEGSLWWACDGTLVRIDPASNEVAETFKVGGGANSPGVGDGAVWLALQQAGAIARFDPVTGKVTDKVEVGDGAEQLRVATDEIWVRVDDDELAAVDAETLEITETYELPGAQVPGGGITVAFGSVWAVNFSYHTVWRIDP